MIQRIIFGMAGLAVLAMMPLTLVAQTSSLYMQQVEPPPPQIPTPNGGVKNVVYPALARTNLAVVQLPEPRRFAMHDLITIVVRESVESDAESDLETDKKTQVKGRIAAFPKFKIKDLLDFRLGPSLMSAGEPEVDVSHNSKFEGEGDYSRKDSFTARITARIIDIKPNGLLVLEARKFIKNDSETLNMILTGTCRKEDISADNTILSTQVYDMRLVKEHTGELRKSTKKGWLTKILDGIFNF